MTTFVVREYTNNVQDNSCRMCSLHLDQHRVSVRLNLSRVYVRWRLRISPYLNYGGATICAEKECRKLVRSSSIIGGGANERVVTNSWTLLLLSGSFFFNISFRERWDPT